MSEVTLIFCVRVCMRGHNSHIRMSSGNQNLSEEDVIFLEHWLFAVYMVCTRYTVPTGEHIPYLDIPPHLRTWRGIETP
jgi:hypothetical protein